MRIKKAYTLLEMVITLLVVGILAALAVPTFKDITSSSSTTEARTAVDALILKERSWSAKEGFYSLDALENFDADYQIVNGASASPKEISVIVSDLGALHVAVKVSEDECLAVIVDSSSMGGKQHEAAASGACSAGSIS